MRSRTRTLVLVMAVLAMALPVAALAAEDYPTKPVNLIIPVGAGGSHDLTARNLVSVIHTYLGQPMLVHLRPGGGGAIGSQQVVTAKPDGYTLLFGGPGWSSWLPAIEGRSAGPDQLMAAARVNYSPAVLFSTMDAPFKTMKEMVEYAKANPGKVIHGNTGPWGLSDLPMKQAMKDYNFDVKIVPYDGGGPALTALLGGHIQTSIFLTAQSLPHIRAGKIRALAVLDTKRHPDLPDVATSVEQGINVTAILWRAVLAPKGTPRPIIEKLASAVKQTTEDPSFKAAIKQLGDVPGYAGPDEFTSIWQKEFETTKELAKAFKK